MLYLTIAFLVIAIVLQLAAAWLALHQLTKISRSYWGWGAFSAMQFILLLQYVGPLEWATNTGLFDFRAAVIGLAVSLLALASVIGLRGLPGEGNHEKTSVKAQASGAQTPPAP